jgi:hypothetical protein
MREFPEDIFSEPANVDVNTLANLGPLTALAGIWEGVRGFDVNPKAEGPRKQAYVERIELEPIDPQTNGPHSSTDCATIPTSSGRVQSRPITIR